VLYLGGYVKGVWADTYTPPAPIPPQQAPARPLAAPVPPGAPGLPPGAPPPPSSGG